MDNTRDLMEFGVRELRLAAQLLSAFKSAKDLTFRLGTQVTLEFNPDSGFVFLVAPDFSVAMVNSLGYLEDWLRCPECQSEGFEGQLAAQDSPCCRAYVREGQAAKFSLSRRTA